MKHKICVIGGSGFVGKSVVSALASEGHSIRVLTRHRERHRELLVLPTVEVVDANVHDAHELEANISGHDCVISMVGILNEKRDNGKGFHHVHVELTEKILEACQASGVKRLLHMSALHADAKHGKSHYLRSKGEAEDLAHATQNLAVTSFRPSVIFGPGDSFINRFASMLKMIPLFFPIACGKSRFAPVYVEDVAQAFVRSLDNPHTFGQRYELCGPRTYELQQIVRYVAHVLGRRRVVIGLGKFSSALQANIMEYVPGKPFSRDNYRSLQNDSVCKNGDATLRDVFGIIPTAMEEVLPKYLLDQTERHRYMQMRQHKISNEGLGTRN